MAEMSQHDLEIMQAQAAAEAEAMRARSQAQEAEINARGPTNTSGSPDDRQVVSDERQANNYMEGNSPEALAHNTYLEARGLAKGVAKAGVGALQTANAVGHSIGAGLGRVYDAVAPSVGLSPRDPARVQAASEQADREQKAFQDVDQQYLQSQGDAEDKMIPIGQVGAGILATGGVGGAVKEAVSSVAPKAVGYVAGGLAGGAAAASTVPQQEGLIVRSDSPIGMGFKIDPNDDAATQQTKKFMNQAIDNMTLGIAGDTAYALGRKGVEYVKTLGQSIGYWNNLPKIQQELGEDIIKTYADLGPNPTQDELIAAGEKAKAAIDKHGKEAFDFGEGVGTKTVQKDTVSTLNAGLDPSDPQQLAKQTELEAYRSSAKRGQAPKTDVRLQEPMKTLQSGLEEGQTVRGGDTAIDQTATVLQNRATQEAQALDQGVQNAKDDLASQSSDYTDVLKKDETFGNKVKEAEANNIKLDINQEQRNLKQGIVDKSKAALETDRNVRNAAYKAVADTGAPANMEQFNKVYEEVKDTLPNDIKKAIEGADGTYGYLYNNVRNRLSEAIKNSKDPSGLYAIRKEIDNGQIDWLTGKSGPFGLPVEPGAAGDIGAEVKAAADNAKKVNTEYSAKWKDTVGDELRKNFDDNRLAIGRQAERGRDVVDAAISNPNRKESIDNLRAILGPENEHLISDTALAKATEDMAAGKGANFDQITSKLQQYANSFGPKQKARLEGFLTDLKQKKISLEELGAKIPELEKAATAEKEAIFNERFPTLFEKVSGKQVPKGNGYDVFQKAMNSEQPRVIDALIKEASKNPADLEGLKGAWLKSAEEHINSNDVSIGELKDNFLKNGKKIFGEDSPEVDTIKALRDSIDKLQSSLNRPGLQGLDATKPQTLFRQTLSTISTWMFGVLNPTAAKINKVTATMAEKYNTTSKAHQAIDTLLSDNQALREAAEKMIIKYKSQMSPAQWKQMWEAGAKLGLYKAREATGSGKPLNIQTQKALGN